MKRSMLISVILLLLLFLSLGVIAYTKYATSELLLLVKMLPQSSISEQALLLTTHITRWEQHSTLLFHFLNHDDLDAISDTLAQLHAAHQADSDIAFYQILSQLEVLTERLYDCQLPKLYHIF